MVYSDLVYCPNVVVGWRSGVRRRRLCVRCEGCCSSNIPHTEHIIQCIQLCVYSHLHAVKNTTICQMVSLCSVAYYIVIPSEKLLCF